MEDTLKDAWADALTSGLYKQSRAAMNRGGGFCCLGVLCEVAMELGYPVVKTEVEDMDDVFEYRLAGEPYGDMDALTTGLMETFDISTDQQNKFIGLNDGEVVVNPETNFYESVAPVDFAGIAERLDEVLD
ncbi:MAG TPA: hypothetical protein VIJ87_01290 [Pyrinomonadaceae bacterium]